MQQQSKHRGQGMTEYIIIVALIAIASYGVFSLYGWTARPQLAAISMELSGQDGTASVREAQLSAAAAVEIGKAQKGLDAYTRNNNY